MYLERCFRCLREQSYPTLEFVLVDDGSTDKSGEMCDQIAAKDGRFKVFHIKNGGASLARKYGLERAKGEFVSFMDCDDCIAVDYIKQLYDLIVRHNTNISACRVQRIFNESEIPAKPEGRDQLLQFDELMPRFFKYEFWGFPAKLYKKSIFEKIAFPSATLSEDYYVMSQLFLQERQMAYTTAPLYYYEYHEGSLSHLAISKRAFEEFDNVLAVYELMRVRAPQYANMALSNVVETCIKLLAMNNRDSSKRYAEYAAPLRQFLRKHLIEILRTNAIYWKLKVVAGRWIIFPL
jgi:glycosyltransferase involved in cell wall biosynthesis